MEILIKREAYTKVGNISQQFLLKITGKDA